MNTPEKYTVIGAGHGGKAMAAHLALMGVKVTLYNRTFDHISVIQKRGGIELESAEGGPHGFGKLVAVTSDIGEAVKKAQVIMVVVPSSAHADIARNLAPHLKKGQTIILHPGRTCGALEFKKVLADQDCTTDVTIAEAETFIYASRSDGPAQARIFRIKEAVPLAALPAVRNEQVLEAIRTVYPQFIDGVTPSVARVLETLDRERVTVASSLGIRARTAMEWLKMAYDTAGEDLHDAIHNQPGYYGINAPSTLSHRYIFEDVPMSLVPIASLGERFGVSVRGMDSIIRLACIVHRTDYWKRGRTVDKLGIGDLSVAELMLYVNEGVHLSEPY